jgi:hypothetical protein
MSKIYSIEIETHPSIGMRDVSEIVDECMSTLYPTIATHVRLLDITEREIPDEFVLRDIEEE